MNLKIIIQQLKKQLFALLPFIRKRYKICTIMTYGNYTSEGNPENAGKKVLVEKSLYNEIIAVYNIFSHQIGHLYGEDQEDYKNSATFTLVKKAKYKLMTPGMEKNKLLFTFEEFNLLKAGLSALILYLGNLKDETLSSFSRSPEFRLVKKVFFQLELRPFPGP